MSSNENEKNRLGNNITREFLQNADRYLFDFKHCREEDGWIQFTTKQDDWYFGIWVHPVRLETVSYMEGDVVRVECDTPEQYALEIADLCEHYEVAPEFITLNSDTGEKTEYYQDRSEFLPKPQ